MGSVWCDDFWNSRFGMMMHGARERCWFPKAICETMFDFVTDPDCGDDILGEFAVL
jgi:hypothetical protein